MCEIPHYITPSADLFRSLIILGQHKTAQPPQRNHWQNIASWYCQIEILGHAPVDVHHAMTTFEIIAAGVPGISTLYENEVVEHVFALDSIPNNIIPLLCTTSVEIFLTHSCPRYFSLHVTRINKWNAIDGSRISLHQWVSELHENGFKNLLVLCEQEVSEWRGSMYYKYMVEVIRKQRALAKTTDVMIRTTSVQCSIHTGMQSKSRRTAFFKTNDKHVRQKVTVTAERSVFWDRGWNVRPVSLVGMLQFFWGMTAIFFKLIKW